MNIEEHPESFKRNNLSEKEIKKLANIYNKNILESLHNENYQIKVGRTFENEVSCIEGKDWTFSSHEGKNVIVTGIKGKDTITLQAFVIGLYNKDILKKYVEPYLPYKSLKVNLSFLSKERGVSNIKEIKLDGLLVKPEDGSRSFKVSFETFFETASEKSIFILKNLLTPEKFLGEKFKTFFYNSPKNGKEHARTISRVIGTENEIVGMTLSNFNFERLFILENKVLGRIEIPQYLVLEHFYNLENNINAENVIIEDDVIEDDVQTQTDILFEDNIPTNKSSFNIDDEIIFTQDPNEIYILKEINGNIASIRQKGKYFNFNVPLHQIQSKFNEGEIIVIKNINTKAIGIEVYDNTKLYNGEIIKYEKGIVDVLVEEMG